MQLSQTRARLGAQIGVIPHTGHFRALQNGHVREQLGIRSLDASVDRGVFAHSARDSSKTMEASA